MSKTDQAIEGLKKIGYTDEKLTQLLELLMPEVADQLFSDVADASTDEEMTTFEATLKEATTVEKLQEVMKTMAQKAYGDKAATKIDDLTADMLKEMGDMTLQIRKTYQNYMAGDPDTVKAVKQAEQSEDVKKLQEEMDKNGFDFRAAAAE